MGFWESNGPERKSRAPTQQWALKTSIAQWVRDNSVSKQITSKFHLMSGKHKCIVGAASNVVPTWSPFSFRALCASAHVTVSVPASPSSCLTLFGKGFQRWQNVFLEVDGVYGQVCKCLWPPMVLYDHGFSDGHLTKLNPRGACRVNPAESWKPSVPRGLLQVFLGHSTSPAVSWEIKWAAVTQLEATKVEEATN